MPIADYLSRILNANRGSNSNKLVDMDERKEIEKLQKELEKKNQEIEALKLVGIFLFLSSECRIMLKQCSNGTKYNSVMCFRVPLKLSESYFQFHSERLLRC